MLKGTLMTIRLLWLVNLVTGVLFYFHVVAWPISVHMYIGFAISLLMIVLSLIGLGRATVLAAGTILMAILLPVIGILQLTHIGRPELPYIQVAHIIIGIASIGMAEVLGKQLKTA